MSSQNGGSVLVAMILMAAISVGFVCKTLELRKEVSQLKATIADLQDTIMREYSRKPLVVVEPPSCEPTYGIKASFDGKDSWTITDNRIFLDLKGPYEVLFSENALGQK